MIRGGRERSQSSFRGRTNGPEWRIALQSSQLVLVQDVSGHTSLDAESNALTKSAAISDRIGVWFGPTKL